MLLLLHNTTMLHLEVSSEPVFSRAGLWLASLKAQASVRPLFQQASVRTVFQQSSVRTLFQQASVRTLFLQASV